MHRFDLEKELEADLKEAVVQGSWLCLLHLPVFSAARTKEIKPSWACINENVVTSRNQAAWFRARTISDCQNFTHRCKTAHGCQHSEICQYGDRKKIERNHNNPAKKLRKSAWSTAISSAILHCSTRKEKENTIMNISQLSFSWMTLHHTTCFFFQFTTNRALPTCECGGQLISDDFAAITTISTVHTICSKGLLVSQHSPMTLWRKRRVQAFNILFHGISKTRLSGQCDVSKGILVDRF